VLKINYTRWSHDITHANSGSFKHHTLCITFRWFHVSAFQNFMSEMFYGIMNLNVRVTHVKIHPYQTHHLLGGNILSPKTLSLAHITNIPATAFAIIPHKVMFHPYQTHHLLGERILSPKTLNLAHITNIPPTPCANHSTQSDDPSVSNTSLTRGKNPKS
jgi:hypothetical protein